MDSTPLFFFESRTPHPWAKISGNLGRRAEITLAVFFPFLTGQVGRMANAGRFVLFFRVCSSHLGWESIDAAAMICRPELAASHRRDHAVGEVCGRLGHAEARAGRADAPAFTGEGDQEPVATALA